MDNTDDLWILMVDLDYMGPSRRAANKTSATKLLGVRVAEVQKTK